MCGKGSEGRDSRGAWAEAGHGEALYSQCSQWKLVQKSWYMLCSLLDERKESLPGGLVSGKNSLGKGKGGSRGQSRHLAVPVSPGLCGPVPNATFPIPTC